MDTLRVFICWCESIDAVTPDLSVKVESPNLDHNDNVREVILDPDDGKEVLDYFRKYEYASIEQVTLSLLWHCSLRRGAAIALDALRYAVTTEKMRERITIPGSFCVDHVSEQSI